MPEPCSPRLHPQLAANYYVGTESGRWRQPVAAQSSTDHRRWVTSCLPQARSAHPTATALATPRSQCEAVGALCAV